MLNNWIVTNLQVLLMGAALLVSISYALSGLYRVEVEDEEPRHAYKRVTGMRALIMLAVLMTIVSAVAFVPAGYRGVVFDQGSGIVQLEKEEGVAFVIPYWQRVHNVLVRTQVFEYESFVQTKDLQEVTLPVAVNYHVIAEEAAKLFQEVGLNYETVIIAPAALQASTEAAGLIKAEAIAQSRAKLAQDVAAILRPQLARHGIFVEYVSVKDAVFDKEFIAAVKAKVIAEQKVEESNRLVAVAFNEAEAVRRLASGDADALAFIGEGERSAIQAVAAALGFTPTEYLLWQRLTTWDGVLPLTVLGKDQDVIVSIP